MFNHLRDKYNQHYNQIKGYNEEKIRTSKFFVFDGEKALDKIIEQEKLITGFHDGYKNLGFIHKRVFDWSDKNNIIIIEN